MTKRGEKMALGMTVAVFCALGGSMVLLGLAIGSWTVGTPSSFTPRRHRLQPVPVSATACPSVRAIHLAVTAFQDAYPFTTLSSSVTTPSWAAEQARLRGAADELTWTIAAGRGNFPPRVQQELDQVLDALRQGRPQLTRATSETDLLSRTLLLYSAGETSVGNASDLVGMQCGMRLAADPVPPPPTN